LKRCCRDARWNAFIDIDEFLVSADGKSWKEALRAYARLPGVHVWQTFFGAPGNAERPTLPVPLAFTTSAHDPEDHQNHCQRAPRLRGRRSQHQILARDVRGFSRTRVCARSGDSSRPFANNHYWSRYIEDLHQKAARRDASTASRRDL
jgi:hypothetical protein